MTRAQLVPGIIDTYENEERAWHRDLANISTSSLRAERYLLRNELAVRMWARCRRGYLWRGTTPIPLSTWVLERITRIGAELTRRERAA